MNSSAVLAYDQALAVLPDMPTREQIEIFGRTLQSLEPEHGVVDIGTSHHVNADLYGRGVVLPAGHYLVGLAHTQPGLAICVGDIEIWTTKGRERFTGAHILQTEPGVMRVGFAHADTTWFTVHANKTGGLDVNAIEDSLVEHPERLMTRRAPHLKEIAS